MKDSEGLWSPLMNESANPQGEVPRPGGRPIPVSLNLQGLPSETDFVRTELDDNLRFVRRHMSLKRERYRGPKLCFILARLSKRMANRLQGKTCIEILRVVNTCQNDPSTFLWGWINPPIVEDEIHGFDIPIGGWIIGKKSQPSHIRFLIHQTIVAETPINIPRPDVTKAHFTHQVTCGYHSLLDVRAFSGKTELTLQAVFENQTAVMGKIQFYKYG
jgi:hypothetical protein